MSKPSDARRKRNIEEYRSEFYFNLVFASLPLFILYSISMIRSNLIDFFPTAFKTAGDMAISGDILSAAFSLVTPIIYIVLSSKKRHLNHSLTSFFLVSILVLTLYTAYLVLKTFSISNLSPLTVFIFSAIVYYIAVTQLDKSIKYNRNILDELDDGEADAIAEEVLEADRKAEQPLDVGGRLG